MLAGYYHYISMGSWERTRKRKWGQNVLPVQMRPVSVVLWNGSCFVYSILLWSWYYYDASLQKFIRLGCALEVSMGWSLKNSLKIFIFFDFIETRDFKDSLSVWCLTLTNTWDGMIKIPLSFWIKRHQNLKPIHKKPFP